MLKRDGNQKYTVVEHECRKKKEKKRGNNQMMYQCFTLVNVLTHILRHTEQIILRTVIGLDGPL